MILYALLVGSLPFDDENIPNLFKKIKNGIYSLPNHLSPGTVLTVSQNIHLYLLLFATFSPENSVQLYFSTVKLSKKQTFT